MLARSGTIFWLNVLSTVSMAFETDDSFAVRSDSIEAIFEKSRLSIVSSVRLVNVSTCDFISSSLSIDSLTLSMLLTGRDFTNVSMASSFLLRASASDLMLSRSAEISSVSSFKVASLADVSSDFMSLVIESICD